MEAKIYKNVFVICLVISVILTVHYKGFAQCSYGSEEVVNGGFECTGTCSTPHMTSNQATTQLLNKASINSDYTYKVANSGGSPDPSIQPCTGTGSGNSLGSGNYVITSNPSQCCDCQDAAGPTTKSGTYAMLIDGSTSGLSVWCQTVSVTAGQVYSFTAWYKQPNTNSSNLAGLVMTVDGTAISGVATLSVGTSYQEAGCFIAPTAAQLAAGSITICLKVITNGSGSNNDMLIDEISFKSVTAGSGCTVTAGACTYNGVSITLPVDLLSFAVEKAGANKSSIEWSTVSEKNSSYFSIEKSEDGIFFYEIGKVEASVWSSDLRNYEYSDTYFSQSSYYRLKIVDIDGSFEFSKIAFLAHDQQNIWVVNNGSDSEELEIKAKVNEDIKWNIAIYSVLGKEYVNEEIELLKGENTLLKKRINYKKREAKICRITDSDGQVILIEMLVW